MKEGFSLKSILLGFVVLLLVIVVLGGMYVQRQDTQERECRALKECAALNPSRCPVTPKDLEVLDYCPGMSALPRTYKKRGTGI